MNPATSRTRSPSKAPEPAGRPARPPATAAATAFPSPVGLYQSDAAGACIYVNERWVRLAGMAAGDALGNGWLRALHPDDRARVAGEWSRALAAASHFAAEYRYLRPDGTAVWVYDQAAPEIDAGGNVVGFVGSVTDISERRLAEESLRSNEARFRALADATASAIWTAAVTGEALDQPAERWAHLTDLPPEEIDAGWLAAVHPDDREPGNARWWAGIAAGCPFEFEQRVRQRDGSWRHFTVRAVPVRGEDGQIREWVGADVDVTERRRAEEALRRGEERYRTLFDSVDQGFCIFEMLYGEDGRPCDYRFEEVNPTFARHTGLVDAVGKTARELVPGLEDHWVDIYGRVAETGTPYRFEQGSAAMGRRFEVEAVRVGGDESRRVALIFSDVTERERSEEALRERARQDAFRAELADALRPLTDAVAIQAAVSRILGDHLQVTRAFFAEAEIDGDHVVIRQDFADGVPGAAGRYRLDDFGAELAAAFRAGRTVVVDDVAVVGALSDDERAAYAAIDVRAHATVCLVKHGRLAALLGVRQAEPRTWTAGEIALLEETAERTWAAVERVAAETALRESERRLQALADAMPQVVWAAAPDGTVRYYNSRVSGFAGVAQTAPGVWDWQPTVHPDDLAATIDAWRRATQEALPYTQEHRILMTGGEYRWHLSRAVPILNAAGGIETWYGTATDIHDLKQAEIARRENEERLRLGIDVAGFALLEIDYEADVIHLSAEAARLYGLGREAVALPREQVHATFHPADRDELTRRISLGPGFHAAEPYTTEYRVVWPSGEVRWLSVRKQIVYDRNGATPRPVRAMLAALDITARKQAEADRQALLDALAHDLRNPLTALRIQAQLLLRQFERGRAPAREVIAERAAGFVELAVRMTGLIDDLEQHAHLAIGGGVAPDREAVDLVALARTSVVELQASGGTHAIRLETKESELVGFWDPLHVRRVVDNLLGNAVKYSSAGSDVRVRLTRAGRSAVLEVSDQGIGIPAADLPQIFAFRHRGGNVGAVAGSGVGLAGVKQIVERHGGTVTAQSEEGRGSVFTVRLPLLASGR